MNKPETPNSSSPAQKGEAPAGKPNAPETNELSFEVCLERLEKIVKELERGDQPLESALELFEEGMKLSANCRRKLEEAENRVEILLKKNDGKIAAEPFHLGSNDEPKQG